MTIADHLSAGFALDAPRQIRVWQFADAPPAFKALSPHGGDEDWLAYVPAGLASSHIGWLDADQFGCGDTTYISLNDGAVVAIGAHA